MSRALMRMLVSIMQAIIVFSPALRAAFSAAARADATGFDQFHIDTVKPLRCFLNILGR